MEFLRNSEKYFVQFKTPKQAAAELNLDPRIKRAYVNAKKQLIVHTHPIYITGRGFDFFAKMFPVGPFTLEMAAKKDSEGAFIQVGFRRNGPGKQVSSHIGDELENVLSEVNGSWRNTSSHWAWGGSCWGNIKPEMVKLCVNKDWYWLAKRSIDLLCDFSHPRANLRSVYHGLSYFMKDYLNDNSKNLNRDLDKLDDIENIIKQKIYRSGEAWFKKHYKFPFKEGDFVYLGKRTPYEGCIVRLKRVMGCLLIKDDESGCRYEHSATLTTPVFCPSTCGPYFNSFRSYIKTGSNFEYYKMEGTGTTKLMSLKEVREHVTKTNGCLLKTYYQKREGFRVCRIRKKSTKPKPTVKKKAIKKKKPVKKKVVVGVDYGTTSYGGWTTSA